MKIKPQSNATIAQVNELRIYNEYSVFQIAKLTGLNIAEIEWCLEKYEVINPTHVLTLPSALNFDDRLWYIYTNRNSLTVFKMAEHLGLSERWVRKMAEIFTGKKYIRTKENKPEFISGKLCLNLQTGIYYKSTGEAAKTVNHKSFSYVQAMIAGYKKNYTDFIKV